VTSGEEHEVRHATKNGYMHPNSLLDRNHQGHIQKINTKGGVLLKKGFFSFLKKNKLSEIDSRDLLRIMCITGEKE
jgi:hypothetical protein